jgi:hypothetical protein
MRGGDFTPMGVKIRHLTILAKCRIFRRGSATAPRSSMCALYAGMITSPRTMRGCRPRELMTSDSIRWWSCSRARGCLASGSRPMSFSPSRSARSRRSIVPRSREPSRVVWIRCSCGFYALRRGTWRSAAARFPAYSCHAWRWPQAIISTSGDGAAGWGSRDSGVYTSSLGANSTPSVRAATARSSCRKVSWTPRGVCL